MQGFFSGHPASLTLRRGVSTPHARREKPKKAYGFAVDSPLQNVYVRHIVSSRFLVGALALGSMLAFGCGPVEYVAQVGGRASSALAQARREKADVLAPYEYTGAGEYLKKSKEEAGRSQFQTALEYGKRAEELANRARALSRERKAGRSWGRDPVPAPNPAPRETP